MCVGGGGEEREKVLGGMRGHMDCWRGQLCRHHEHASSFAPPWPDTG